jgi:hypothetical protein
MENGTGISTRLVILKRFARKKNVRARKKLQTALGAANTGFPTGPDKGRLEPTDPKALKLCSKG